MWEACGSPCLQCLAGLHRGSSGSAQLLNTPSLYIIFFVFLFFLFLSLQGWKAEADYTVELLTYRTYACG